MSCIMFNNKRNWPAWVVIWVDHDFQRTRKQTLDEDTIYE